MSSGDETTISGSRVLSPVNSNLVWGLVTVKPKISLLTTVKRRISVTVMKEIMEVEDMLDVNPEALRTADLDQCAEYESWLVDIVESEPVQYAVKHCTPRLAEFTEGEIVEQARPTNIDQLLRVSFWEEVNAAADEHRKVNQANIYRGICSVGYWNRVVRELDWKMTYVLMPIKSYNQMNKLLIHKGQQAMLDILNADPYLGKQGKMRKLDARIAKVQLDAYKLVVERMFGRAVERSQKHITHNDEKPDTLNDQTLQLEIDRMKTQMDGVPVVPDEFVKNGK